MRVVLTLVLLTVLIPCFGQSKTDSHKNSEAKVKTKVAKRERKKKIPVVWDQVEFYPSLKSSDYANFVIRGITKPGANIQLYKEVVVSRGKKVVDRIYQENQSHPKSYDFAGPLGEFELSLVLPRATVQLPIQISHDGKSSYYLLMISLERIEKNKFNSIRIFLKQRSISLGLGATLFKYTQTDEEVADDLEFESTDGPSVSLDFSYVLDRANRLEAGVTVLSKIVLNEIENLSAVDGDFGWRIATFEHVTSPWSFNVFGRRANWGLRYGLESHAVSYFKDLMTKTKVTEFTNFTIGPHFHFDFGNWYSEFYIRYQLPLLGDSDFLIRTKLNFDGNLKVHYRWSESWAYGFSWFGQWMENEIKFASEGGSAAKAEGTHNLFFTNFSLQAVFSW